MTLGWGMEMKGVLFVFGITSYIPTLIIWKNVKERSFSSSKCLIQSKEEENDPASGELHFPH